MAGFVVWDLAAKVRYYDGSEGVVRTEGKSTLPDDLRLARDDDKAFRTKRIYYASMFECEVIQPVNGRVMLGNMIRLAFDGSAAETAAAINSYLNGNGQAPPLILSFPDSGDNACVIQYTDCDDRTTKTFTLSSGETAFYGDWDGSSCVRKEYKCP
jgi:hypothetical protein